MRSMRGLEDGIGNHGAPFVSEISKPYVFLSGFETQLYITMFA
jgi:hypothetical protein